MRRIGNLGWRRETLESRKVTVELELRSVDLGGVLFLRVRESLSVNCDVSFGLQRRLVFLTLFKLILILPRQAF